jgi:hypothetical protein
MRKWENKLIAEEDHKKGCQSVQTILTHVIFSLHR